MIVTLSTEEAQALHWLARHLDFHDALRSAPPHLGKSVCMERAYDIIQAAAALQEQIEKADLHGDAWMYRSEP